MEAKNTKIPLFFPREPIIFRLTAKNFAVREIIINFAPLVVHPFLSAPCTARAFSHPKSESQWQNKKMFSKP